MNKYEHALPKGAVLKGASYQYRIEKVLGQGSFGITYLASVKMVGTLGAIDAKMQVAIKEFFMDEVNGRLGTAVTSGSKEGLFHDYKKKFVREARNLGKLQHPNIIKVVEEFEANNTAYYVMEYIDGGSLDDYIFEHHGLSADEAVRLTREIGGALSFMHSKNMLHLDLKPGNIMRRRSGVLILIDFGLSKQYDKNGQAESSTTIGKGTRGYAPIEQMYYQEGKTFPVTMDVYALGATLLKMLTGETPPDSSSILNEGFPHQSLEELGIGKDLLQCVAKAMAPKKDERYQSIAAFIKELATVKTEDNEGIDEKTSMDNTDGDSKKGEAYKYEKAISDIFKEADKVTISYTPQSFGADTYVVMIDSSKVKMILHPRPKEFEFNQVSFISFMSKLHFYVSNLELRTKEIPYKMEASEEAPQLQIEFFCRGRVAKRLWIAGFHCQFGNIIGDTEQLRKQLECIIPFREELPKDDKEEKLREPTIILTEKPERHDFTSLVLWGLQIAGVFSFIVSIVVMYDQFNWILDDFAEWFWRSGMPHVCIGSIIVLIFNGMVLRWKKAGFLYLVSFILLLQYTFVFYDVMLYLVATISSFVVLAVYYGVLKIPYNGKSTWMLLKPSVSIVPDALLLLTLLLWAPLLIGRILFQSDLTIAIISLIVFAMFIGAHVYLGRKQIKEGKKN